MNNLFSYCVLVYTRISASEKDFPVILPLFQNAVSTRSFTSVKKFFNTEPFDHLIDSPHFKPQYDKRLFIELQVQYMKIASSEYVENMLCT